jgi:hypothetical protein
MNNGTNAPSKPQHEGQIIKFISPHNSNVILYDIAVKNTKYNFLEWYALNDPTPEQQTQAG